MTFISKFTFTQPALKLSPLPLPDQVVKPTNITVVVPVFNNQQGIDRLLESLITSVETQLRPGEIIIVDNSSPTPIIVSDYYFDHLNIKLLFCRTPGPAAARNVGYREAANDWILFVDSDCTFTEDTIPGYLNAQRGSIAYCGNISGNYKTGSNQEGNNSAKKDIYAEFHLKNDTLRPLHVPEDRHTPQYVVTANTLIWKRALEHIGGFNEKIMIAAGEDIDLGFKLSQVGKIAYADSAIIAHDFGRGPLTFARRFFRYGNGIFLLVDMGTLNRPPIFSLLKNSTSKGPADTLLQLLRNISLVLGYFYGKFKRLLRRKPPLKKNSVPAQRWSSREELPFSVGLRTRFKAKRIFEEPDLEKVDAAAVASFISFRLLEGKLNIFKKPGKESSYYIIQSEIGSLEIQAGAPSVSIAFLNCRIGEMKCENVELNELLVQDSKIGTFIVDQLSIANLVLNNNDIESIKIVSSKIKYGIIFSDLSEDYQEDYCLHKKSNSYSFLRKQTAFFLDQASGHENLIKVMPMIKRRIGYLYIDKKDMEGDFFRVMYYRINKIHLTGISKSLHTSISTIEVGEINVELFQSQESGFNFKHLFPLRSVKEPQINLLASTLGKNCVFQKCDLSGFSIGIQDTKLRDMTVQEVKWPAQKRFKPRVTAMFDQNSSDRADMFLELKMLGRNSGDKDLELMFKRHELNERFYQTGSFGDKILLFVSRSNNFGTNWLKALGIFLTVTILIYLIVLTNLKWYDEPIHFARYVYVLDPTHKYEDLFPGLPASCHPWLLLTDFGLRIITSFFIFQVISAFRKHSQ